MHLKNQAERIGLKAKKPYKIKLCLILIMQKVSEPTAINWSLQMFYLC